MDLLVEPWPLQGQSLPWGAMETREGLVSPGIFKMVCVPLASTCHIKEVLFELWSEVSWWTMKTILWVTVTIRKK